MPDIAMCKGGGCELKELCYRYTAEPSPYMQSYFTEPPFKEKMGGSDCEYYWPNRKYEIEEEDDVIISRSI